MARSVADLKIAYRVLAGWHPNDPFSVPAALEGPPVPRRAAIVTEMPSSTMPKSTVAAIRRAGQELEAAGWAVEEAAPPELARVNEIWAHVLNSDLQQMLPLLEPVMSEGAMGLLHGLLRKFDPATTTTTEIYTERDRLAVAQHLRREAVARLRGLLDRDALPQAARAHQPRPLPRPAQPGFGTA